MLRHAPWLPRDPFEQRPPLELVRSAPRLTIALIAPSRHPIREPFAGGLEAHVHDLAGALRARGHTVSLFGAEGSDHADTRHVFTAGGWDPTALAATDPSMPGRDFLSDHHEHLRLMLALAGPLGRRFDVVHNHSLHHLPVAMAPSLPVPMLTTLHTPPTPWLESAVAIGGGRGTAFACVSAHTARQWAATLPDAPHVVPNGVDLRRWPRGPGGGDLLWSGRLVREKAPHLAIEAARRAGRHLSLAGPVSDPAYVDAVIRPHLGHGVTYLGHLDQRELAAAVGRASAVLATPMWDEPFGLVVAEALACGTPVVTFARGGVPEVLTDASLGRLVEPGDVAGLAAAIPAAQGLDRAVVRAHAVRRLSHEAMVDRYEGIYAGLVGRESGAAPLVGTVPAGGPGGAPAGPVRHLPEPVSRWATPIAVNASSQPSMGNQPQRR